MCIICVSEKGVRQPSKELLRTMFSANPDGAGYMVSENGKVRISKGYMNFEDFYREIKRQKFSASDVVVYHFRISTQAGVKPSMTQPFPYSDKLENMKYLDCLTDLGIAHNGIIRAFSDPFDREYSDTAHFIAEWFTETIKKASDIDEDFCDALASATFSRFTFLDGKGNVKYSGNFIEDFGGLKFSNMSYLGRARITKNNVK